MEKAEILDLPFESYGLGEEFSNQCAAMGYKTLRDITGKPEGDMFKKKDFSYLWLEKLSEYLKIHGQLGLL